MGPAELRGRRRGVGGDPDDGRLLGEPMSRGRLPPP